MKNLLSQTRIALAQLTETTRKAFEVSNCDSETAEVTTLESRIMLSATPVAVDAGTATDAVNQLEGLETEASSTFITTQTNSTSEATRNTEVVFIDDSISDAKSFLTEGAESFSDSRNLEIVRLNSNFDGIKQISEYLNGRTDVKAVHLITPGETGSIKLGNTILSADGLKDRAPDLANLKTALQGGGDLLLYGNNLGSQSNGNSTGSIAEAFQSHLQCDVTASDDATGSTSSADWTLETQLGNIETETVLSESLKQNWTGELTIVASLNARPAAEVEMPGVQLQPSGMDDTAAIQDAINSLKELAAESTETVYVDLAEGDYTISGTIWLAKNVGLRGAGMDLTNITATTAAKHIKVINAAGAHVENLTLTASNRQTQMVYVDRSENVVFDGVRITGLTEPAAGANGAMYGLRVRSDSDGFVFQNSMIDNLVGESNITQNSIRGLFLVGPGDGLKNVKILNNTFKNIYSVGDANTSRDADGIYVAGYSTGVDILIDGNSFENGGSKRAIKDNVGGLTISNNTMSWDMSTAPAGVTDPTTAIALQSTVQSNVNSTIHNNSITALDGGFRKSVFVVGVNNVTAMEGASITNNVVITPQLEDVTRFNMDGLSIGSDHVSYIEFANNQFFGWYRMGVNGTVSSLGWSNNTFESTGRGDFHSSLTFKIVSLTGDDEDSDGGLI